MELRDLMDMIEVPINGKENQTKDSFAECTIPADGEIKLCEKNTNDSTEKSVTQCEPPELIICMKEASYNVVKDICIDEGVPTLNKISVENSVVNHDDLIIRQASSLDVDRDLIKGAVEDAESISDVVKPLVECEAEMDVTSNCPSEMEKRSEGGFNSRDGIVNDACSKMDVPENNILVQELETENSQPEISISNGDGGPQQSDQVTSREADSNISKEEVLSTATEESNHENATEASLNGNMDSTTLDTTSRDGDPQNSEAKQLVQPVKTVNPEDTWPSLESRVVSSRMFTHHGYGESSFSVSDPLSSLVTYSGHLPYSGSISLRSDSSTTSTRSFAFPILNSEWTSSPVKMAKADGRHFRKHQRWKLSLLCCRF